MPIVSSQYVADSHTQPDGSVYVTETHTDQAGTVYQVQYRAPVGYNKAA